MLYSQQSPGGKLLTLLAGLLSVIFALLAVVAHLFDKGKVTDALLNNNTVKDQLNTLDAKILGNQAQIDAEKSNLAAKEQGETNDSILSSINSNIPKS